MKNTTPAIDNAIDYYSYGKVMPPRNAYATNPEGYHYLFTGHEKDGETSYQYHGARYVSVDRYAMKFFHQSPYVYAGNMPINALDVNGEQNRLQIMKHITTHFLEDKYA